MLSSYLRFTVLSFALIATLAFSAGCKERKEEGLAPGRYAPIVELENLQGEKLDLTDFRGKFVLLNFWTSWCLPCKKEMPDLDYLSKTLGEKDFAVVAVAVDDNLPEVKRFVAEKKLSFPVLFDRGGKSTTRFKLAGFPESFILDPEGRVLMVSDPGTGNPVTRIVGPRDWASPSVVSAMQRIIQKGS